MTWTSSGTTITQTGTDTSLSGLNGLAGITTSTAGGYYTRYTLASNYNIIINGTVSFNTSTTFEQLYLNPANLATVNTVRVNGTLNIGTNQNLYLQNFALNNASILQEGTRRGNVGAGQVNDGSGGAGPGFYTIIWVAPGGTLNLYGSILSVMDGLGFSATGNFTSIDSQIRAESWFIYCAATLTRTRWINARSSDSPLLLINQSMAVSEYQPFGSSLYVAISGVTPGNTNFNFSGVPALPTSISVVGVGRAVSTDLATARFYNLASGSDYQFDFTVAAPRYYLARLYQQVTLTVKNSAGTAIQNALVRITGKSGSTVYDNTTNASGVTSTANVELAFVTRNGSTGTIERYCVSNNTTDDFNIVIYSYAHLFAELPTQVFKSQTALSLPWTLFADAGVTQTNTTTVAAYTGITVTSSAITISQNNTLAQVYDFVKLAWRNNQYANRPIRSGNYADFGAFTLTISGGTLSSAATFTEGFTLTGALTIASPTSYTGGFFKPSGNTTLQSAGIYAFSGKFSAGTTITVASGETSLDECEFSGTTINVSSGSATVFVTSDQFANVTAGANVTIQAPLIYASAPNFAQGTRVQVSHRQIFTISHTAINTTTDVITLGNDSNSDAANFRTTSPNTLIRFSLSSGATIPTTTPQIVDGGLYYWKSGGQLSITEGGTAIDFTTQGNGSFVLVAETEKDNSVVGASGYNYAMTLSTGSLVRVKARYWQNSSGCTASEFFDNVYSWSGTSGITIADTVSVTAIPDAIHNRIIDITQITLPVSGDQTPASDGSTVTGLSFALEGTGRIQINANDADGVLLIQDVYIWGVYITSTQAGIRLASSDTFVATDLFNYIVRNLELDNTGSIPLKIIGGRLNDQTGGTPIASTTSASIFANVEAIATGAIVETSSGGGSSDWTTTEKNQIRKRLGLDGTTATPSAIPDLALASAVAAIPTNTVLATDSRLGAVEYKVCADKCAIPASASPATYTVSSGNGNYNFRSRHTMRHRQVSKLKLGFVNWWVTGTFGNNNEVANGNSITIKAAIEYDPTQAYTTTSSATFYPITFNSGSATVSLSGGSQVVSDEVSVSIPPNHVFFVRTLVTATNGQTIPITFDFPLNGEGVEISSSSDRTTGAGTFATTAIYSPALILGNSPNPLDKSYAFFGDSIARGFYDTTDFADSGYGFSYKASQSQGFGYVNFARSGDTADKFANTSTTYRLRLASTVRFDGALLFYGANDLFLSNSATIQANIALCMGKLRTIAPIWLATILPRTGTNNSVRTPVNAWIRTTPAPSVGYFEFADAMETARDSGTWNSSYSTDLEHPNSAGHSRLAQLVFNGSVAVFDIANSAIDGDAIATSAITRIQSGLATASSVAAIPTNPLLVSDYTAPDNAGISALTNRLTSARAGYLDNLSGGAPLLASNYVAPANASIASILTNTSRVDALIENSGGDRFTAKALESAPAGGGSSLTAADVWNYATRSLTDKSGFSLTQSFPANFANLGINSSGHISRVTLVDTTTVNSDMRGTDNALLASSYTAPDNTGISALTSRLSATRAEYLDNLSTGILPTLAQIEASTVLAQNSVVLSVQSAIASIPTNPLLTNDSRLNSIASIATQTNEVHKRQGLQSGITATVKDAEPGVPGFLVTSDGEISQTLTKNPDGSVTIGSES